MKLMLIFLGLLWVQSDSWLVWLNGKQIANGTDKPTVIHWTGTKKDKLVIEYQQSASNIKWKRNFVVTTVTDSILSTHSFAYASGKFEIPCTSFSSPLTKMDTIKLHTEQHPADEQMMVRSKIQPLLIITKK